MSSTEGQECQSIDSVPIALSWVCTAARLTILSLQAATVYGIVYFFTASSALENEPLSSCNLSSQQQRLQLGLAFTGIWTTLVWAQISNLLNIQRGLVCLVLLSNAPQIMSAFLHIFSILMFTPGSVSVIIMMDNFLLCPASTLWKGSIPGNTQELRFWGVFPLAPWRMKGRL